MTTKTAAQRGTAVSVKSLAITAICLVLVYVFTAVVNIRLPFAPNGEMCIRDSLRFITMTGAPS